LVALDLGEVGVEAHRRAQARRDAVVDVEAHLARVRRGVRLRRLGAPSRDRRGDGLQTDSLAHAGEPGELAGVDGAEEALSAAPSAPEDLLVPAPDRALEVDAPRVEVRFEVERAEGDPDFRRPAVGAHRGARLPDAVPRLVRATAPTAAAEDPVAHEPGGVDLEELPGAPVPERV